jgi:hypothetical protein
MNEREINYAIGINSDEISYFLNYKNQLKKFSIDNRHLLSKVKMNKILIEIEHLVIHINNLKTEKKELIKLLDKIYYGNNSD